MYIATVVLSELYGYTLMILSFQVIFQLSMTVMNEVSFMVWSIGLMINPLRLMKPFQKS
jgi:hypothetical protein